MHERAGIMNRLSVALMLTSAFTFAGCRDKSIERRTALWSIGMGFSEYVAKHGTLPVPPGQTIESQVPAELKCCPTCGKAWSYSKITAEPATAKEWNPIIAWCANCESEGGKRDALFYHGKSIPVAPSDLPK